ESEPLMAAEEAIERRSALPRRDCRLRRHLPDERIAIAAREIASTDGWRRHHAAAADEGPEPARKVEAGEDGVARRSGDPVRRHDDRAEPTRDFDHLAHDRGALDLIGVEDCLRRKAT